MENLADQILQQWQERLETECPTYSSDRRSSIAKWLVGNDPTKFDGLENAQLTIVKQAMDYRFRILQQRYLGLPPEKAYRTLMQRLGGLVVLKEKIRAWLTLSRDRQRTVVDVLQEIVQEMLQSDNYIKDQLSWIAQCTPERRMRDVLLFATVEEYCLRPIRNQPLLAYRFVNYLRRSQRGGVTNIPQNELIKLVSDEIVGDDSDTSLSLLDRQAIADYQQQQEWEDVQLLRTNVRDELHTYLVEQVGEEAGTWLLLYLQGKTPQEMSEQMAVPISKIYRLREKITYHAIKVFAIKSQPELVSQWLQISLKEHQLGLTGDGWQTLQSQITERQKSILTGLKEGKTIEFLAKSLGIKTNQVVSEWSQVYLAAQSLRTGGKDEA
jgi:hypothetical protein